MKQILLILSILFSGLNLNAQIILHGDELKDTARLKRAQIVPGIVQPPDTILIVRHNPVVIMPPYVFLTQRQREKYDKLAYNVKKVWPYAKIIKRVYAQLTDSLSKIDNEEDQKAYIKSQEKLLRAQFEDQLVKLSITQGRILIKLVDRETGSTTYEVLKELKGSFSAFIFQGIARLFGSNLKSEYDALEEDKMIEDIIVRIENGQL
ncbi:MAG: DUF4294 domain-containing protein [Bacteroidales bacterium]|nr:DUF4294 domain-containing protein [Bacteroidales bacterium]